MSSDIVLSVRNLTKEYRIPLEKNQPSTAAEALIRKFKNPGSNNQFDTFRALKDVSFDIHQGDVVGVIGRNGAGKSTLLKVLSRITEPTSGEVRIRGKIGSLLEVGTGFHPELTGRENIFLNGAILGMRRTEIARQFDAIVDFSEVGQFLDTPVKRYSSGMYVRLAFAVAAHLNPDILIVDEVLAVGDLQFQQKCLGKMQEVSKQDGRTVLFVSHNMGAVRTLCKSCIFMERGTKVFEGDAEAGVSRYLAKAGDADSADLTSVIDRKGTGKSRFTACSIVGIAKDLDTEVNVGRPAEFRFKLSKYLPGIACSFTIYSDEGFPLYNIRSTEVRNMVNEATGETDVTLCWSTPQWLLLPGQYRVNAALFEGTELVDHIENIAKFDSHAGELNGISAHESTYGRVALPHTWHVY